MKRVQVRLQTFGLNRKMAAMFAAVLACVCLAAWPHVAFAQNDAISVETSMPERGYAGDAVPLVLTVSGTREAQPPVWPTINGVEVSYLRSEDRSSSFTMSVNGQTTTRRSLTTVMVYEARFSQTGVFELGPVEVTVGSGSASRTLWSNSVKVQIAEPMQDAAFGLQVSVESTQVYVGQPVAIKATWSVPKPVRNVRFSMPFDSQRARLVPGPESSMSGSPLGNRQAANRAGGDPRWFETTLNGEPILARLDDQSTPNRRSQSLSIDAVIIPQSPGPLELGPVRVDYEAVVGQRPRRFTDAPWDDLSVLQRQVTIAEPLRLEVRALPADNRPADFSGLVGVYELQTAAKPTSISVGEPIELTVSVRGPHPIALVPPMDLASSMRPDSRLRLPGAPLLPTIDGGVATFSTRIRARSDRVTEIPSVGLSYFDSAAGEYRTTWSKPITIKVRPSNTIGLPDHDESSEPATLATSPNDRPLPDGMADIARSEAQWLLESGLGAMLRGLNSVSTSTMLVLGLAPPAAYFAAWLVFGVAHARNRDPSVARVRMARKQAVRAVRSAPTDVPVPLAGDVLRTFIGDCVGLEGRACSVPEALAALPASLNPDISTATRNCLIQSDRQFDLRTSTGDARAVPVMIGPSVPRKRLRIWINQIAARWHWREVVVGRAA